jgi:rod shape-determining protein MreD
LGSGLLAAVSGAFLSGLSAPFGRVDLTLIVACGLIGVFRPTEALAVALGAGLSWDALTGSPPGAHLLAMPLAVWVSDLAFRRLLSNLSWPSFAVLNGLAFLLTYAILGAVGAAANRLAGWSAPFGFVEWFGSLLSAALMQVLVALIGLWLARVLANRLATRYIKWRHVRY